MIADLALDQIDLDYMMRDRIVVEAAEIEELKASIIAHGLRLPIEVVRVEEDRYGLVSGWRRVTVLRQLQEADPDTWPTIKAIIRPPYEAAELYTAMVEENELRAQVTPYERGRIAVVAANLGAFPDTETAIETIFSTASKAKRSKIRSFAHVHDELGDMLKFPTDLSERNGLRLAYALREGYAQQMRGALFGAKPAGPAMEWAVLEPIVAAAEAVERLPDPSRGGRPKTRFAKTTHEAEGLANGVTMERVLHEDGYSIRLRGAVINVVMVDQLMDELRRWLGKLPD